MSEETVETPQPAQPVESKSSDWPKIILVAVLGFGLLAGSAYAGYWYGTQQVQQSEEPTPVVSQPTTKPTPAPEPTQPVTDPTAGWETHTNNKYGYNLKYEQNPKLKQFSCSQQKPFEKGEEVFVLDETTSTFPECGHGGYSWPISITTQEVTLTCDSTESWTAQQSQINVGGIKGTRCDQKFVGERMLPGPDEIIWAIIQHDEKYFVFNLGNIQYSETFNQILSTFKFLD